MKKIIIIFAVMAFCSMQTFAQTEFSKALENCDPYVQEGSIPYSGQIFNLRISLEKARGGKCTYREKIYQDIGYEELICNFEKNQLQSIAKSMESFSNTYKKELAKNKIFEAKMSSNGDIFQRFLVEPKICKITHSKKK